MNYKVNKNENIYYFHFFNVFLCVSYSIVSRLVNLPVDKQSFENASKRIVFISLIVATKNIGSMSVLNVYPNCSNDI